MLELFGHLAYANLMFWSNPGGHDGLPGKHPSTTGMVTKMFHHRIQNVDLMDFS